MLGKLLKQNFSRNLLRKKYAFVGPLDVTVPPNLVYLTNLQKPTEQLLTQFAVDELITIQNHPPFPVEESKQQKILEKAESNISAFRDTLQQDKAPLRKNKNNKIKNLFISTEKHIAFDRNLHKQILDSTLSEIKTDDIDMNIQTGNFWEEKDEVTGTLSKLDFYDFNQGYFKGKICRLEGKRVVKVKRPVAIKDIDLETHLLSNMNRRIEYLQSRITELKDTSKAPTKTKFQTELDEMKKLTDISTDDYIFKEIGALKDNLEDNQLRLAEYEIYNDFDSAFDCVPEEEKKLKETFIACNTLLRNLMKKTNFISPKQFLEIGESSDENAVAFYYNHLVALMVSKHILSDEEVKFLLECKDALIKAEYVFLVLSSFSNEYTTSWLSLDVKSKGLNISKGKGDSSVKEIYEHLKSMHDQASSPSKKLLIQKVKKYIDERKLDEKVLKAIVEELDKFSDLNEHDSDFQNTKNYLETVTKLPFGVTTEDERDIGKAEKILENAHFGMDDVKRRILEFLAIGKLNDGFVSRKIVCLLGPPGTGKTSIAKSIAECLGRKFVRISLGGENDVSVLKGHRRTYLGSYPGKIVTALKQAESENPVILLDEIDKLGRSNYKGNIQDVLLEILDPVQNKEFMDNYLELPMDLSKVLFLCSANLLDSNTISPPLYDRMEVIELSGYTKNEKIEIFRKHLYNKLMEKVGLEKYNIQIDFTDELIDFIIEDYAREPGVRGLEKKTQILLEKIAFDFIEEKEDVEEYNKENGSLSQKIELTTELIKKHLGPKIYGRQFILHEDDDLIGFALGLGYNAYGGSVLSIEILQLPEKPSPEKQTDESSITIPNKTDEEGSLTLTGSLGDVMKESVEIAYSFAKLFLHKKDDTNTFLDSSHLHMHFPEGASKKDGPSAGITIVSALISMATGKRYNTSFAMTGEVSLGGKVMKIGGLREKVLAAKREGVMRIICPEANRADVEEFKDYIKEEMEFNFVKTYEEVYDLLFN